MLEIMLLDCPHLLTTPTVVTHYSYMLVQLHMLMLNIGKGHHITIVYHYVNLLLTGNVMRAVRMGMCSRALVNAVLRLFLKG